MNRFKKGLTGICFSLFALLILSGCAGKQLMFSRGTSLPYSQAGIVKAMTFNIRVGSALDGGNSWSKRKGLVMDALQENAADVIGLQEALNFQVEQVQNALPQYSRYAIGRSNGKRRGEACAIFYRKDRFGLVDKGTFWFSNTPQKPGSKRMGNIFPRICSWVYLVDKTAGKGFYVYNLHLDNLSQSSREKSVRLLADRIAERKTKDPFIVMGDFNMELNNPAMRYLQKIGYHTKYPRMVDAWQSVHARKPTIGTYHKFKGRLTGPKIDHIPISAGAEALSVKVDLRESDGRYPSDHFPVIATIRLF